MEDIRGGGKYMEISRGNVLKGIPVNPEGRRR